METELETRENKAVALFEEGYNCSQAVFMAYSDIYGIDNDMAAKIATSFGGGMGRLREVCGAVSGMFLLLGFKYPYVNIKDRTAKNKNYQAVQSVATTFKTEMGSYICADLLKRDRKPEKYQSTERSDQFYKERPCTQCVRKAAHIIGKEIFGV